MQLEFMADAPVGKGELYVYLDEEGVRELLRAIDVARQTGDEHLLTSDWGGRSLTKSEGSECTFNKVTVAFVSKP